MALHVALTHHSRYRFSRRVGLGPHIVRLRPAPHCRTDIRSYALTITPAKHFINWQQDPFGNFLARVVVPEKTVELTATVALVADMVPINPFDFFVEDGALHWPFAYEPTLARELGPYLEPLPATPLFADYAAQFADARSGTIDFVCAINRKLSQDIDYRLRMEPGVQTSEQTLASQSGSCRDTGWLLVQLLRRAGLAARFVSGYLIQLKPDAGVGPAQDFTDLHAWAEVYIPGAGWIGLDPTSGLLAGEGHIPLAATPSPSSAAPISGTHEAAEVDFSVTMDLARITETPRVTKPYSEAQWEAIMAMGARVEQRLQAGDVRLSIGGEPTFVAADTEAPEWTIVALGPTKRTYADKLARRLCQRFAPGGLLHYGQGKWYPGEQSARWAFGIYWRSDGAPLWRDPSLIGEEAPDRAATVADARIFAAELSRVLGLAADSAIPAFEDVAHFALLEQKLPPGVMPGDNRLVEPADRERLIRVFERGLDEPAGFVLPLLMTDRGKGARRFITERWSFKRGHLYLVAGDSPLGLRLPLGSLPEIAFVDYPDVLPADPFVAPAGMAAGSGPPAACEAAACPEPPPAGDIVRTALAVEPRDGHLCVFLPPVADGEDYAALIAAIEAVATKLAQPVRLEGYAPPFDPRLNAIKVTPDPGVIEVNVHPARSWDHAVEIATIVHEEAAAIGLSAEKFRLDGRHLGTGGGNHIVLGGLTPPDSPFLRRPDLLASMVVYWQNHPALSYLFAGQFVGPTSQAPRVDEGRHDSLYELEIALAQIPERGGSIAPWLVDRLFRNLLIDVTGNTHRAEICIDKLYAPEGPMGRLGLVELRAMEMSPHPRMGLAQQLLVRALIAWFWESPYCGPFVRWGTALHDRFMLPHFLWADLDSVLADLRAAGFAFDPDWFQPQFEFRFPRLGAIETAAGVALELRQALEPWLVLGEEEGPGTSRRVDSSLERVQVMAGGLAGTRYIVACNGCPVLLTPTGQSGQAVAGVRFRAWPSAEGFHPTIRPHAPLTFDIVDSWSRHAIGGCRYHVSHPGGRNFQVSPVNALEAESRRHARFESMGHSAGKLQMQPAAQNPEFPLTLDLRRARR